MGTDVLGIDFDVGTDWGSTFRTVSGRTALAQSILRRLQTNRGHWPFAPDLGFNLRAALSGSFDPRTGAGRIAAQVEEQCLQDPRVESADVTVSQPEPDAFEVVIHLADAEGPFDLVLAFASWTAELVYEVR